MKDKAIFVDLDGTLIDGQSHFLLAKYLYRKKFINMLAMLEVFMFFVNFKLGLIARNIEEKRKRYYMVFCGW